MLLKQEQKYYYKNNKTIFQHVWLSIINNQSSYVIKTGIKLCLMINRSYLNLLKYCSVHQNTCRLY